MKQKSLSYLSIAAIAAMFPLAAQAQITADWLTPLGHIGDTANWSTAELPNQAGDVGNATSGINISLQGSNNWLGTLNVSGASVNLTLQNTSVTGTWSDVNLSGGAWLRSAMASTAGNRDFGNTDGSSNITIGTGGATIYRSVNASVAVGTFNIWGTVNVNGGLLTSHAERNGKITVRNNLNLNNGNSLFVNAGFMENVPSTTISLSFANNGDTASRIYGSGAGGSRFIHNGDINFDLSGFDWDQTAERSWTIFDWGTFENIGSGFNTTGGIVTTGASSWIVESGTDRYYAGSGGLVWTFTDSNNYQWTFNEAAGTLSVVPEPSTVALLTGLLALGVVFVRRRTSK